MAGIVTLALVGMGSSMILAEMMKGEATAINHAGSLRMQSYLITTRLLADNDQSYRSDINQELTEFDERMRSVRITSVLPENPHQPLRASYDGIVSDWSGRIRPLLTGYARDSAATRMTLHDRILPKVDQFVAEVDRFVTLLDRDAESKIRVLRMIQGISLFLTLIVVYVTMYLMRADVLSPLMDLLSLAARVSRGDFSGRARYVGDDELGRLGNAFNVMGEDLSKMYAELESRVAEKTADLERSNRSLELLYNTSRRLNDSPVTDANYTLLLKDISKVIKLGPGAICLAEDNGAKALPLATTVDQRLPNLCNLSECNECLKDRGTHLRLIHGIDAANGLQVLSVPLLDGEHDYGLLMLQVPGHATPEPWQVKLVETIGRHIGVSIGSALRATQSRRLSLFEERSALARELHDSLAQSLSYLKIQISRLQSLLDGRRSGSDADAVLRELREGVTGAYRQLRELLTTFRIKIDGRGLSAALEETVAEFRNRCGVAIALVNRLQQCPLSANEEIHVLQIVRESLSNVVRHARAIRAQVTLECDETGEARITVDDDGVGLGAVGIRKQHYGLIIMQERAARLGGILHIVSRPQGGARVELLFTPVSQRSGIAQSAGTHSRKRTDER